MSAADVAAWRRWASGAKWKRKKRRKKKLPKASSGRRSCDHAAQVPAVLAAREREGASDSVHRQILEIPVAPQRQSRTVQTVQVTGDSTVQFLGEIVDAPVVVQRLMPGMVQTVQETSGGGRRSCEHATTSSSSSAGVVVQTVQKTFGFPQVQFLDKTFDVPVVVL